MSVNKTSEEIAAFNAAVAQSVEALIPELRARLFEEFRQEASGSGSGGGTPVTISGWLEKFGNRSLDLLVPPTLLLMQKIGSHT
ncbi:hypothetical protein CTI12_AA617930 [Artemisia annua]|uniref:Zinc finger, CCHC-type, retrotransposon Gag domain protein n=1 Tax=Artemisia annua TaxID=35608 RepID=A0A2U1KCF9_ARTAN|nr:hypothetical protein CTI12_AA617930 [Artemisia annua]